VDNRPQGGWSSSRPRTAPRSLNSARTR
jgi:hypothetical protein